MLNVSYCDSMMSVIRQQFSLNNISSLTNRWIVTKFNRNDPWVSPFKVVQRIQFNSKFWLLWQPKGKLLKICQNYWSDFKIIWYKGVWVTFYHCNRSRSNYFDWLKNMAAKLPFKRFPVYKELIPYYQTSSIKLCP